MGKIRKITANELVGGTGEENIYPITAMLAIYDPSTDGTQQRSLSDIIDNIIGLTTKAGRIRYGSASGGGSNKYYVGDWISQNGKLYTVCKNFTQSDYSTFQELLDNNVLEEINIIEAIPKRIEEYSPKNVDFDEIIKPGIYIGGGIEAELIRCPWICIVYGGHTIQSVYSVYSAAYMNGEGSAANEEKEYIWINRRFDGTSWSKWTCKDDLLQENINAEKSRAELAETNLLQAIENEASVREERDDLLLDSIDGEVEARKDADRALQESINQLNTKVEVLENDEKNEVRHVSVNNRANSIAYKKVIFTLDPEISYVGYNAIITSQRQVYLLSSGSALSTSNTLEMLKEVGTSYNNIAPSTSSHDLHIKLDAAGKTTKVTLYVAMDGYSYMHIQTSAKVSIQDITATDFNNFTPIYPVLSYSFKSPVVESLISKNRIGLFDETNNYRHIIQYTEDGKLKLEGVNGTYIPSLIADNATLGDLEITGDTVLKNVQSNNIIPESTLNWDLGSKDSRWRILYVNSINSGAIFPREDNSFDIGNSAAKWRKLYANEIYTNSVFIGEENNLAATQPWVEEKILDFLKKGGFHIGNVSFGDAENEDPVEVENTIIVGHNEDGEVSWGILPNGQAVFKELFINGDGSVATQKWTLDNTTVSSGGIINLYDISFSELGRTMSNLKNSDIKLYIISDSDGNLPSVKGETFFTITDLTKTILFGKTEPFGVSVGDLLAVTKRQCKIIPLNDAKAANGDFPGADGLESVWDKTQINKIAGIESKANAALPKASALPSKWESNMNNALDTGVYVWCTLGRPAGSTGAYTCITFRTSTNDGNYDTIEQTAYGREAELGRIFKRIIFYKSDGTDTQYGDWQEITTSSIIERLTRLEYVISNTKQIVITRETPSDTNLLWLKQIGANNYGLYIYKEGNWVPINNSVELTSAEYQSLVDDGKTEKGVIYNVYEG